jgi:hypothetical protein
MFRQRIRERPSALRFFGQVVTLLFAAGLVWYGLMTLLLALKVSPDTVNSISGYRTAFDWLAGLTPQDVDDGTTRAIIAGSGIVAFLLFGYLAFKMIPRPRLTRHDLPLVADDRGAVIVEPRAIERLAETAAEQDSAVTGASGRYADDDVTIDITVRRARDLPATLRETQHRVSEALAQHELPTLPVNVTLTGYDRRKRRELN